MVYSIVMKQATITITDDLEQALERYRQGSDNPLELEAIVQRALRDYLDDLDYLPHDTRAQRLASKDVVLSRGGKPEPLTNAPVLDNEHSVARAVIENRGSDDIIFPTGLKPVALGDAPVLRDGSTVAEAVIEDRR